MTGEATRLDKRVRVRYRAAHIIFKAWFARGQGSCLVAISLSCSCPELPCELLVALVLIFNFFNLLSRFFVLVAIFLSSCEPLVTRTRKTARQDKRLKKFSISCRRTRDKAIVSIFPSLLGKQKHGSLRLFAFDQRPRSLV